MLLHALLAVSQAGISYHARLGALEASVKSLQATVAAQNEEIATLKLEKLTTSNPETDLWTPAKTHVWRPIPINRTQAATLQSASLVHALSDQRLEQLLNKYGPTFHAADPFAHAVIDDGWLPREFLRAAAAEIPEGRGKDGCNGKGCITFKRDGLRAYAHYRITIARPSSRSQTRRSSRTSPCSSHSLAVGPTLL